MQLLMTKVFDDVISFVLKKTSNMNLKYFLDSFSKKIHDSTLLSLFLAINYYELRTLILFVEKLHNY